MKKYLVGMVIGLFVLAGDVFGQELELLGTVSKTDNSVTRIMKQAGCDYGWTSQVFVDTGISPTKPVQVGQEIYLQVGLCLTKPPAHIVALTQMIFRAERGHKDLELRSELTVLQNAKKSVADENRQLKVGLEDLKGQLAAANKRASDVEVKASLAEARANVAEGASESRVVVWLGAVILLAILAYVLRQRRKLSEQLEIAENRAYAANTRVATLETRLGGMVAIPPDFWTIEEGDHTYEFKRAGDLVVKETPEGKKIVGRYECCSCPEGSLFGQDKNLRNHARRCKRNRVKSRTANNGSAFSFTSPPVLNSGEADFDLSSLDQEPSRT